MVCEAVTPLRLFDTVGMDGRRAERERAKASACAARAAARRRDRAKKKSPANSNKPIKVNFISASLGPARRAGGAHLRGTACMGTIVRHRHPANSTIKSAFAAVCQPA